MSHFWKLLFTITICVFEIHLLFHLDGLVEHKVKISQKMIVISFYYCIHRLSVKLFIVNNIFKFKLMRTAFRE